jgi:hypothetical protein
MLDRLAAPVKVCGPTLGLDGADVAAGENVVSAAPVFAGPLPPSFEPEPEEEPESGVALALGIGIRPTSPPFDGAAPPAVGVAVMKVTCGTVM